jgi:hypothetical protein
MGDIIFDPSGFVKGLEYMGLGLLGTFVIIGIIIGVTMAFNNISNKLAEKKKAQEENNEQ